jgi:hypothetical protein
VYDALDEWRLEQTLDVMQALREWGERKRQEQGDRQEVWAKYRRRRARARKVKRT